MTKNWDNLIDEYESLMGKKFLDENNVKWTFLGLLHGQDDYYYVIFRNFPTVETKLLSCVGKLEDMGYRRVSGWAPDAA